MRWLVALFVVAVLAGCAAPAPEFRGVEPLRVRMGGGTFDIRVAGRRAEAIRRNPRWAPRLAAVGVPAVMAIEAASGCRVARLSGDQARMVARLNCGAGPPPPRPPTGALFCEIDIDADGAAGIGQCVPADETWPQ